MKVYGMELSEGSRIGNLTVPSGDSFPDLPDEGEIFFRVDLSTLFARIGGEWQALTTRIEVTGTSKKYAAALAIALGG
jgi:hypothetical protein